MYSVRRSTRLRLPQCPEAKHKTAIVEIHCQHPAPVQRVIPEPLDLAALVTLADMRRRFQIAFAVVLGQQHVVAEQLVSNRRGALDG